MLSADGKAEPRKRRGMASSGAGPAEGREQARIRRSDDEAVSPEPDSRREAGHAFNKRIAAGNRVGKAIPAEAEAIDSLRRLGANSRKEVPGDDESTRPGRPFPRAAPGAGSLRDSQSLGYRIRPHPGQPRFRSPGDVECGGGGRPADQPGGVASPRSHDRNARRRPRGEGARDIQLPGPHHDVAGVEPPRAARTRPGASARPGGTHPRASLVSRPFTSRQSPSGFSSRSAAGRSAAGKSW